MDTLEINFKLFDFISNRSKKRVVIKGSIGDIATWQPFLCFHTLAAVSPNTIFIIYSSHGCFLLSSKIRPDYEKGDNRFGPEMN
jgi:hypothetical protein